LARGFYVVLDMHHYRQLDGDQVDKGELEVDPAVVGIRFLTLWRQIAQRFQNKSDRLLFEIYNEPHGKLNDARWNDLMARALRVIRETNPTRVVVVGPTRWNSPEALPRLRLPNDANLIMTVHHYEPFNFTHQGASWVSPMLSTGVACCDVAQRAAILARLDLAKSWSDEYRYPIFLGEFGAYRAAPLASRITFMRFVRDAAEAREMSWAYWEMAASFGVYDPIAHDWHAKGQLRDALVGK
jgi:endoglucanase